MDAAPEVASVDVERQPRRARVGARAVGRWRARRAVGALLPQSMIEVAGDQYWPGTKTTTSVFIFVSPFFSYVHF